MSTTFLTGFSRAIVARLVDEACLEIAAGREEQVIAFLAAWLHREAQGGSLITGLVAGLTACPDVRELYADDDELKALVEDLDWAPGMR